MKKPVFLLLCTLFALTMAISVHATASQVDSAETLAQALQDAKVTEIHLTQDIELPAEGLPVNMEKKSLSINGGGSTLRATGAGLLFGAAKTTKYEVQLSSIRLLSEDQRPVVSASADGKDIIFTFQDVFFAGMQLVDNPPGTCVFNNTEFHVGKYLGNARNITYTGTNTIVRLSGTDGSPALFTIYPPNTGNGESQFTLQAGSTLAVADEAANCGGFLYNQSDEMTFFVGEKAQLIYEGSNRFITGNNIDTVRVEPSAVLNVRLLGSLSAPILSVNNSLQVGQDATARLLAVENTRSVSIVYIASGGRVSFSRAREVLLFNGCVSSSSDGLALCFEGGKKSLWANQTQLVELWGSTAQAYYGALGMPDGQWRNGAGGLFKLDATMGESGSVAGLKLSDYSGAIELSRETLSLSNARILRVAMQERPDYLLSPFIEPEETNYASSRTRDPLWDEDGNYIGPGSEGESDGIYDDGTRDDGFVDLD